LPVSVPRTVGRGGLCSYQRVVGKGAASHDSNKELGRTMSVPNILSGTLMRPPSGGGIGNGRVQRHIADRNSTSRPQQASIPQRPRHRRTDEHCFGKADEMEEWVSIIIYIVQYQLAIDGIESPHPK